MNGEDILRGLGHIPEEMIQQSAFSPRHTSLPRWIPVAAGAVAAALLLIPGVRLWQNSSKYLVSDSCYSNGTASMESAAGQEAPLSPMQGVLWNPASADAAQTIQPVPQAVHSWKSSVASAEIPEIVDTGALQYHLDSRHITPFRGHQVVFGLTEEDIRLACLTVPEAGGYTLHILSGAQMTEAEFLDALSDYLTELTV